VVCTLLARTAGGGAVWGAAVTVAVVLVLAGLVVLALCADQLVVGAARWS